MTKSLILIILLLGLVGCGSGSGYGDLDYEKKVDQQHHIQTTINQHYNNLAVAGKVHYNYNGKSMQDAVVGDIYVNPNPYYQQPEVLRKPSAQYLIHCNPEWEKLVPQDTDEISYQSMLCHKRLGPSVYKQLKAYYSVIYTSKPHYLKKIVQTFTAHMILEGLAYAGYLTPIARIQGYAQSQAASEYAKYIGKTLKSATDTQGNTSFWVDFKRQKIYGKIKTKEYFNFGYSTEENVNLEADIVGNKFEGIVWGYLKLKSEHPKLTDREFHVVKTNPVRVEGQFNGPVANEITGLYYAKDIIINVEDYALVNAFSHNFANAFIVQYEEDVDQSDVDTSEPEATNP